MVNEKEVHLRAGWSGRKSLAIETHGSSDTRCLSFRRGAGAERALRGCRGQVREKGRMAGRQSCQGVSEAASFRRREKGSSSPDGDS